ncbi:PH domain-containing protein [Streptomyces sp. NPDC090022]|uniref:PH domain-containing protein n=1 Tax=Streptomyces sp. NPDC090022 TaxID=3365920 RepID=UPI0038085F12
MGAGALPREYRIKAGRMTVLYLAVGLGTPAALLPVWTGEDIPGWVELLVTALLLALFGWLLFAARRCATSVDLKGIRVRGFIGQRRLAWAEIQDIRAVPNPAAAMQQNAPGVITYAYGPAGRRVLLMYVDDLHVAVDREVELIRGAWTELRGADWRPDPEAERRIGRQNARDGGALLAVFWAIGAMSAFLVLFLVLLLSETADLPAWPLFVVPVVVFLAVWLGSYLRNRDR